jgi:hypothetical protein
VWSASSLLARLADVTALAMPLADGARVEMWSSHDRNGGNGDGGAFFPPAQDAPTTSAYVRYEGSELVLLDERRPGCLVRQYYATGIVLRRLFDASPADASELRVLVAGHGVDQPWYVARPNPYKVWLEADLDLPIPATPGEALDVTLVPAAGRTETAYGVSVLARTLPEPGGAALAAGVMFVAWLARHRRSQ